MREIELGKLLGEKPQPNIVEFIGCVTTQGKSCICGNCVMYDEIKCPVGLCRVNDVNRNTNEIKL